MDFSFGIITDASPDAISRIRVIISSIRSQNIPNHEIIIIGNINNDLNHHLGIKIIPFDESIKPLWITRKKNMITDHAAYENVVYMHDYFKLDQDWYENWLKFGNNFKVAMNQILNTDGTRYRDWTMCYDDITQECKQNVGLPHDHRLLLPYAETGLSKLMYISGAYWVAKKSLMQEFRMDERLSWGEGEDLIWSHRVRERYPFSMNPESIVHLFDKSRSAIFSLIDNESIQKLRTYIQTHGVRPGYGAR